MSRPKLVLESRGLSYALIVRARTSEKAFAKVIKITDRIAIRFGRTSGIRGMEIDDVIQESRILCLKLIKEYHDNSDAKFTTYFTECLKNHFGHIRGAEKAQKRKINFNAESLFKETEDNFKLIDTIVDEKQEESLKQILRKIEIKQLMELLDEQGYALCRFILRDLTFTEISKRLRLSVPQVKSLFKKHVVQQIEEAKRLNVI